MRRSKIQFRFKQNKVQTYLIKEMEKLPIYDLIINEADDETGVYLVSFVDSPAIEKDFVKLSDKKDEFKFKVTEKMKQYLTGPVLVPDMLIYRMSGRTPYYVRFSAQEIEKIVRKFFRNGFTHNTNQQHEIELDANYVFESWIVQDPENDKSKAMGFSDIPAGTWMMTYHIPDQDFWNKEIMTGNAKGFSIEGFFDQVEMKMEKILADGEHLLADGSLVVVENNHIIDSISKTQFKIQIEDKMKDKTLLGKIKDLIFKTNKMKFAEHTLQDGRKIFVDDETKEAFLIAEDGTQSILADGEYTLVDGTVINVLDGLFVDGYSPVTIVDSHISGPGIDSLPITIEEKVLVDERVISIDDVTKAVTYLKDGVATALEDGEFELKDGSKIMVKDGLLVEVAVEDATEEDMTETHEQMSKLIDQLNILFDKQKSKIDVLEEKLSKQGKAIAKLEKSFEEFSKAPAGKEVNFSKSLEKSEEVNPKKKNFIDFSKFDDLDKIKF